MALVKHEEEATTELGRTDFGERLNALGIERDPDGGLRFGQLAYADAVRTYFWTNFPGLRDDLRDWIGQAAGLPGLTTDDRVNIVVRFGERSLAIGRPDDLFDLVVHWADGATRTTSTREPWRPSNWVSATRGSGDGSAGGCTTATSGRLSDGVAS